MTNTHPSERSSAIAPEHTAVRVALWRALHALHDQKPLVFQDELGAQLVAETDWQQRPDMNLDFSRSMRASIVGRARFVEDLLEQNLKSFLQQKEKKGDSEGLYQYVILGAGLDTFAFRRKDLMPALQVFEVDQPGPQAWKKQRLEQLGWMNSAAKAPSHLHFVPVDFEQGQSWWEQLKLAGWNSEKPTFFVSTGVSMYLSQEANQMNFQQIAGCAPGSQFATTFMLSVDLLQGKEKDIMQFVMSKAQEAGTPFLSLFHPEQILKMADQAGFSKADYISAEDLYQRYFANRTDQLRAGHAEAFLVATVK